MIWLVAGAVLLGGFAVGWVLGMAYGVHQEQRLQANRAFWIAAADAAVSARPHHVLPLYDQDAS